MSEPIAIVGIGCRFPGAASSPDAFWRLLVDGVDAITEVPPGRFDLARVYDPDPSAPGKMYTRWGGFVDGIDQFDPSFFGFSRREALRIDPQHRMLLEVAWEALEDAGLRADRLAGSRTGVFVGLSTHDYGDYQAQVYTRPLIDAHTNSGGAGSIAANRISYVYDFRGPSFIVDTACSSALVAVHLACQSLRAGECELALAGGAQAVLNPELTIGFCKASMISPDGRCRAFAAEGNGYVRGEGAGIMALKPLAKALADGDPIYAVIRGSAINEDGRTNGMTVPSLWSQQSVLRDAYQMAGVRPGDVHYIEAHGPGTPVGDPIEAEALASMLAAERPAGEVLRIGSVKTNIGHLEAASGIAGIIKAALVARHRHIPPSLHFKTPNPAIPFDRYRLKVTAQAEAWPADVPVLTGVNSFGFGGANAHVVLEGPPSAHTGTGANGADTTRESMLFVSARSQESLRGLARRYRELLLSPQAPAFADLAAAAARHRSHHDLRLTVAARDNETAADHLDSWLNQEARADVASGRAPHGGPPRVAFVFAGMGPQWWGMGRQLMATEPVFREVIETCDRLIRRHADWSLLEELQRDAATSRVADADLAQPVNFAFQAALLALWKSWGVEPAAVVGHSAGEIAAVYATGALDIEEAVRVAFYRGLLQHRATGKGRMLAVGQGIAATQPLIDEFAGRVAVAAVNSPQSVTLSGDEDAIEAINARLQEKGVFSRVMSVLVPYHSHHMDPIEADLLASLAGLRLQPPSLPIVSEVTGDWAPDTEFDAAYWWRNIRQPVLFGQAIETMIADGFDLFLEVSPHPVLGSSVGECLAGRDATGVSIPSLRRNEKDRVMLLRALGQLVVRGVEPRWDVVLGAPSTHVRLPLYAWNRERVWLEAPAGAADAAAGPAAAADDTTMIGHRVRAASPVWEVNLGSPALDFITDHKIHGAVVFPGAGYVAMGLDVAAAMRTGDGPVAIDDVEFKKALFVPEGVPFHLQAACDPASRQVRMHAERAPGGEEWDLHSACRLGTAPAASPATVSLESVRARCPRPMRHEEFYAEVAQRGFTFGPRFMGIESLLQGDGEALGRVCLPADHAVDVDGFRLHPALFDAGLQVLIAAVMTREQPHEGRWPAFLPTKAAKVTWYRAPGAAFWSHATVQHASAEGFEGTVTLLDEQGQVLLQVDGLCAKTLEATTTSTSKDVYRLRWAEAPSRADGQTAWCAPAAVAAAVDARADALSRETGFAGYYGTPEAALDTIARAYFERAIVALGGALVAGRELRATHLPDGTAVSGARQRQWQAILDALTQAGRLVAAPGAEAPAAGTTGTWRVADGLTPAGDPAALAEALRTSHPRYASVLDVVERCGLGLADVLGGRRDAPDVLFSGEGVGVMATFYRHAPSCQLFNTLTGEAVAAVAEAFPADRAIRLLEVGGGTGAATHDVLPRLGTRAASYTFTDISPLFVGMAKADLGDHPALRFATLDVERDPAEQGIPSGSADVVIASNVVHATKDVRRTLDRLHALLAPGGVLVLQEITRRPCWLDLVFGITDGWWAFEDTTVRPRHALLDVDTWRTTLAAAGFDEVGLIREHEDAVPGQAVFVARRAVHAAAAPAPAGPWLVYADRGGVAARIAAAMAQAGHPCLMAWAGPGDRVTRTEDGFVLPAGGADAAAAAAEMLQMIDGEHRELAGVLHAWSLDMPAPAPDRTAEGILAAQASGYESLLAFLHARRASAHPRVVLLTAEAQAVDDLRTETAVLQAPLWGVGRVLLHEHPELQPRLIDISSAPGAAEITAIALEVTASEREDEVLVRGTRRWVRRLEPHDPQARGARVVPKSPANGRAYRLDVGLSGAMDSLTLREIARRPLRDDEVEIEVRAASLNFRDVVFAMGLLPSEAFDNSMSAGAMGVDCAGIVSRVGTGVTHVRPGDAVMALAPASLATHAITRDLVLPIPPGFDMAQAAALPLAYVTAVYALETVGRIRRGERVLIHAATGGVGLAAIAVARRNGAEIFATAGTDAKREHLRRLGITQVMDSRSTDFADEVMAATGGRGVDLVLNSLTGEAIAKSLAVLAPLGRFLEIGKSDIFHAGDLPLEAFRRNLAYFAIQVDGLLDHDASRLSETFERVRDGLADGSLPALPIETFSIADVETALRTMAQAKHIGKLVVAMDRPDLPIESADAAETPLFRADGTYLITGGRGGVGVALAQWAADAGARHLFVVGRHATRDESAADVQALRARGVEVRLVDADVSRRADVDRLVAAADRPDAPLRGVFHSAMVIDDAPLGELDAARFARVFAPKAGGGWNLHLATAARALDHFVLFSSITSVYGNGRQANYAAANAFLDALAGFRRAQGLPGLTINWGVFADAGYVSQRPDVAEYLTRQGQHGLPATQAFTLMSQLMTSGAVSQAMIARTDWNTWAAANPVMGASARFSSVVRVQQSGTRASGDAASGGVVATLLAVDPAERPQEVLKHLRKRVGRILGTAAERIEPAVPLTEMGMDSLMAVELMTALKHDVDIDVPAVKLLQGLTTDQLAGKIVEHLAASGDAIAGAPAAPQAAAPAEGTVTSGVLAAMAMREAVTPPAPVTSPRTVTPARETHAPQATSAPVAMPASVGLLEPEAAKMAAVPTPAPPPAPAAAREVATAPEARPAPATTATRSAPIAVPSAPAFGTSEREWRTTTRLASAVVRPFVRLITNTTFEGAEHLPDHGPYILATNHLSMWDAPVLLQRMERRTVILLAEELRSFPWLDWTLHKIWDGIYVRRGEADTEALEQAVKVLRGGGLIGLAPEGKRTPSLERGLTGVAYLAMHAGVPVVPVALWGQQHVPRNLASLTRTPVHVRVGPPLPPPAPTAAAATLREYTDQVMVTLARMLPAEYRGIYAAQADATAAPPERA